MAIPGFQDITLPLLRIVEDGNEYRLRDVVDAVANHFDLTPEERSEKLPSGQQTVIHNRVGWARTYLVKAGILEATRRGYLRITDEGRRVLGNPPERIDAAFLRDNYAAVREFAEGSRAGNGGDSQTHAPSGTVAETPEESLEQAYQYLRWQLAKELLAQVKEMSPEFFERLVVELLVKMGYGGTLRDAGQAVGQSGDGGIDGIIKEDRLGLDVIYIQAKRYDEQAVGRPAIQAFVGALQGVRARKGIFITTSRFAQPARDYANNIDTRVILIDGEQLAEYMMDYNLGVSPVNVFEVKRIDSDYFTEM